MNRRALILIPALLILWSCSESSLFLGEVDEPAQLEVETLADGSVVEPGGRIPLRISRDPVYTGDAGTTDQLIVELLDHAGTVLAEMSYDSVDGATDLPSLELPEVPEGLYTVRTSYYDGDELVASDEVPFFVVSGTYRIVGLTSYPASSYPEADGLLRVSLDIPFDSDPFLVWRVNDSVIESGYLSDTGTTVAVLAPEAQGVFPVQVDLYPVWPEEADFESIPAPTTYFSELYVSNAPAPARTDLVPADSYFALFHFRGSFRDDGVRVDWFPARDFAAHPVGAPELAARSGIFGYYLDGESALRTDGSVWPVFNGELSPVSISFRLLLEEAAGESVLMRTEYPDGDLVTVLVDEQGRVGLDLAMVERTIWSELPLLSVGMPETVTISLVPGSERSTVQFFAAGQFVSSADVSGLSLDELASPRLVGGADRWALLDGSTFLGAESNGFVGVIDEFGVFFRDDEDLPSTNTMLFRDSMEAAYGDRLVYAASFGEDSTDEEFETSGDAEILDGALVIAPGASVEFPDFGFEDEDLIVTFELRVGTPGSIHLYGVDSAHELTTVALAPEESGGPEETIELTLAHADGILTLEREDEREVIAEGLEAFAGVRLIVEADASDEEEQAAIELLSLVARRDRPQIPRRLFQVSDE